LQIKITWEEPFIEIWAEANRHKQGGGALSCKELSLYFRKNYVLSSVLGPLIPGAFVPLHVFLRFKSINAVTLSFKSSKWSELQVKFVAIDPVTSGACCSLVTGEVDLLQSFTRPTVAEELNKQEWWKMRTQPGQGPGGSEPGGAVKGLTWGWSTGGSAPGRADGRPVLHRRRGEEAARGSVPPWGSGTAGRPGNRQPKNSMDVKSLQDPWPHHSSHRTPDLSWVCKAP
jgi:hypothetical protein